ncbi:hypothetical protein D3C71_1031940 [compost metagenome]
MVLLQPLHQSPHLRCSLGQQQREDMELLILMVQWRSDIKVAQHIARGLARALIGTLLADMFTQAVQQCQRALHALVAGLQHGEGLFEPDCRCAEARNVASRCRSGRHPRLTQSARAGPGGRRGCRHHAHRP